MAPAIPPGVMFSPLTAESFDSFWLHHHLQIRPGGRSVIDLRGVPFIDMFSSVGLLYCCRDLLDLHACQVQLKLDGNGACAFLPRIGFLSALDPRVMLSSAHSLAQLYEGESYRGNSRMIIELTRLDSDETIKNVLNHVMDVLVENLYYSSHEVCDLASIFSELCHNVPEHAGSNSNGLAAMQIYRGRYGPFMQFVVADQGVGILETLQRNPTHSHLVDDVEAIAASLQPRTSEYLDESRGNGLAFLVERVHRLKGRLHIRSGSGKVYVRTEPDDFRRFRVAPLTGTQVSVTFPARDIAS